MNKTLKSLLLLNSRKESKGSVGISKEKCGLSFSGGSFRKFRRTAGKEGRN